jgi:hypothetical protein
MRVTLELPDHLHREPKKKAAHEGRSMKELVVRSMKG